MPLDQAARDGDARITCRARQTHRTGAPPRGRNHETRRARRTRDTITPQAETTGSQSVHPQTDTQNYIQWTPFVRLPDIKRNLM